MTMIHKHLLQKSLFLKNIFSRVWKLQIQLPNYRSVVKKLFCKRFKMKKNLLDVLNRYRFCRPYTHFVSIYAAAGVEKERRARTENEDSLEKLYVEKEIWKRISYAKYALDDKELERAQVNLEKAISLGEKVSYLPVGLNCVYEMLAYLHYSKGDIKKAEDVLINAIKRFTTKLPFSDNLVLSFNLKLARLYYEEKNNKLAEFTFTKCLVTLRKNYYNGKADTETGYLWINTLFWYGKFLYEQQRYIEASSNFENCYNMCCHVNTVETPQVIVILHNLAGAAYHSGDSDKAIQALINGLILGRPITFVDLPVFYVRVANLYIQKGNYEAAKIWCEKSRNISRIYKNRIQEIEALDSLKELSILLEQN